MERDGAARRMKMADQSIARKNARVQHTRTLRVGTVYRAATPDKPHICVLFDGDRFTLPVEPHLLAPSTRAPARACA